MEEQRDNNLYNHPQSSAEINQEPGRSSQDGSNAEQKIAVNPNPRANANIKDKNISTREYSETHQAGSETDGEDG